MRSATSIIGAGNPHRLAGGQAAGQEGRPPHHRQRDDEGVAPAEGIARADPLDIVFRQAVDVDAGVAGHHPAPRHRYSSGQ